MTYLINVTISYKEQRRRQRIQNERAVLKALWNATRSQYHNVR